MVNLERDIEKIMLGEYLWGISSIIGPFNTAKAWLLRNLDNSIAGIARWRKEEFELLRLAIDSIPDSFDANGHFVLGHPDFNYQNIFVDDEGIVTNIIDWDGVHTLPCTLGFARYPSWITRDWDPIRYVYDLPDSRDEKLRKEDSRENDLQEENSLEDDFPPEDPPEALLYYRRTYAAGFANLELPYLPDDTRPSQILEAIKIGVGDRICRPGIIKRLLEHAFDGKVPFTFPELCDAFEAGKAGPWKEEVREAFGKMWHED